MKKVVFLSLLCLGSSLLKAQGDVKAQELIDKQKKESINSNNAKDNKGIVSVLENSPSAPVTAVKNQGETGTCWCFSTISLIESQCQKNNIGDFDLSEMYNVRWTYLEKAKNYILRQGATRFDEGALGHDLINSISKYGAVPEALFTGVPVKFGNSKLGKLAVKDMADSLAKSDYAKITSTYNYKHDHTGLVTQLKNYLDGVLAAKPIPQNWAAGFDSLLTEKFGPVPQKFVYNGKEYTPTTFASQVLKFNPSEYVNLTSFTHHPYYSSFVIEVPDNFSNGSYINLPLDELLALTKDAVKNGYSVLWDADVSNDGFMADRGHAIDVTSLKAGAAFSKGNIFGGSFEEGKIDAVKRQRLFEDLTTQDDHLMHIVGLTKTDGKTFFKVKNSWGAEGFSKGYLAVTENYFAINTISIIVPKAALSKAMLEKIGF